MLWGIQRDFLLLIPLALNPFVLFKYRKDVNDRQSRHLWLSAPAWVWRWGPGQRGKLQPSLLNTEWRMLLEGRASLSTRYQTRQYHFSNSHFHKMPHEMHGPQSCSERRHRQQSESDITRRHFQNILSHHLICVSVKNGMKKALFSSPIPELGIAF